jgi:xylan 1,4-beta-xylosidase
MYSSYTAASFARKHDLAAKHEINLEGALTWAFEFEDQPFFAGFRVMASNGIDLPVLNVFRMLAKMTGKRVAAESDGAVPLAAIVKDGVRDKPDVAALASLDTGKLCVMVWHYHDEDVPGPAAVVSMTITGLPFKAGDAKLTQFRIDEKHSNAFTAWKAMGSPQKPTPEQYADLERAGQLTATGPAEGVRVADGKFTTQVKLDRQAVALLVLEWTPPDK